MQSRAESLELLLEAPAIVLSTFKPSKANVKGGQNGSLILKIAPGEVISCIALKLQLLTRVAPGDIGTI